MQLFKFQYFQQVINYGDVVITCQMCWQVFVCLILFDFCLFTNVGLGACRNPILKECEDDTHTPKMGTWESSGTPKNLELDCRGQNTSPWSVLYTIGKVLKRTCQKWPRMGHLDICNTSHVRKKGRESNWQFDSRALKVGNQPDPSVCKESGTHHWKALKESYKFA
jgi:hypothetical protein